MCVFPRLVGRDELSELFQSLRKSGIFQPKGCAVAHDICIASALGNGGF
jgi:hypothetical protein